MRTIKLLVAATVVAGMTVLSNVQAANQIQWYCTAPNVITNVLGTALTYATYGANTSGYVQLIYAGPDGAIDPADQIGDGATDDDVVVATSFIGAALAPASRPGHFSMTGGNAYLNSYANGSVFFIRAWDLPSLLINTVPQGLAYYGDSQTFLVAGNNPTPAIDNFSASTFGTTTVVPEPATGLFALAGLGVLAFRRMRQRNG